MTFIHSMLHNTSVPACLLAALLALPAAFPVVSAQAASITVLGGGGGGGGGGEGASTPSVGGTGINSSSSRSGNGGLGGNGASGSGNAGGGGGAGTIGGTNNTLRNGTAANGATGGTGGQVVGSGTAGTAGANVSSGSVGGAGGAGGDASHTSTETTADNIGVYGGMGGAGGQGGTAIGANGGTGGVGGASSLIISSDINVTNTVHVVGGNGGQGAFATVGSGTSGTGGTGGDATFSVGGGLKANLVAVYSGDGGDPTGLNKENPGTGGNVSFTATTLTASYIDLNKRQGNLAFKVTTLDVTSGDTALAFYGTTAGSLSTSAGEDGVYIGTARLGNGSLTTVYQVPLLSKGQALIDTLELVGSGTFNDTNNPITLGKLAIDGGTLNAANWSGIVDHAYTTSDAIELKSGGGTVNLGAGEDKDLSRVLEGAGGLTKTGAGVLTLSGTNTYSGNTTISGGTLSIGSDGNIGTGGTNTIGDKATLLLSGSSAIYAKSWTLGGADSSIETANNNTLSGALSGSGGLTKTGLGVLTLSGATTYTGMTTVRSGTLALGSAVSLASSSGLTLYGGAGFDNTSGSHSLDGKTLNVEGSNGQSATYTGNLSAKNATLNFISPLNPTQPLLTVSGNADISNSAYNVGLSGGTQLAAGSQLTLLEVDAGKTLTADNLRKGGGIVQIGSTVAHDITASTAIDPASGRLVVDVSQGHATDQSKALSEGFLSGVGLAVQGADLAAGQGTLAAVNAARSTGQSMGFAGFGALSGASTRYDTGSHVDMYSLSLLTGLALGADIGGENGPGRLTVGAFFEYGNGSYDTYNSFSNAASVHGDGNSHYLGGGLLARMDFAPTGPGRFYAEASGRAGSLHNSYNNSDLRDASGRTADYDSDTPYYGLHFGAGYVWNFNDKASLDLYGKYFWTRVQGDSLTLSTGEHLKFEDVDSNRLRFGGRLAYTVNEYIAPYVGAAWEHEFNGKARAATNGFDIDAPNLRGDTGIGELGLTWTPSVDLPLSVDLGVQGYTGKREGVSGALQVKWEF